MPSEAVNAMTRQEWRELGFFYDRDDSARCCRFIGSKAGLGRFADLLHAYAADARHDVQSEHAHFGPYMYLKVMTWSEAGIDRDSLHGTLCDLRRLAALVGEWLASASPGDVVNLAPQYEPGCAYQLQMRLEPDGFDPVTSDQCLN